MRNSFHPGTSSPLKQIFQNVLMRRILDYHNCFNTIYYKEDKLPKPGKKFNRPKECNSLFYIFENSTHSMYKIVSIEGNMLTCIKQGRYKTTFPCLENTPIDFSYVGVYKIGPLGSNTFIFHKSQVHGKVIRVGPYLITCPINVLREK